MQIHNLQGYIQSIYLVEDGGQFMLLDGCCRADVDTLAAYFRDHLQRPLSDLHTVIVTHMHPDHAGAAHQLRKLSGCQIVSAKVEKPWYRGLAGMLMHWTDIALAQWVAGRMGRKKQRLWYSPVLRPDRMLTDGEDIPGFEDWCVLDTPGHTDRDLSVLHKPSQRLYVADLLVKVKKRYIPPFPVFYPNRYKASIEKLKQLRPASIMLAHGGEVVLSEDDYQHLTDKAPEVPKTHWRATKMKLSRMFGQKVNALEGSE